MCRTRPNRADEADAQQLFLEGVLQTGGQIEVTRGDGARSVKLDRRTPDKDGPLEPAPVHRFAGLRKKPKSGLELRAVRRR